jgi:hypothetical protein
MSEARVGRQQPTPDIAQVGALSAAILAALIGADPLDLRSRTNWVKALDYTAFSFWIITVVLFMLVLAFPTGRRHLLRLGVAAAIGAGLLTIIALSLLPFHFSEDRDTVALVLTGPSRSALDKLCGTTGKTLRGSIPTATLGNSFVTLNLDAASSTTCDAVRIPASAILAIREHPSKRR